MSLKKIIILYPYNYLAYAPTVLNLYKELELLFDVKILCTLNETLDLKNLESQFQIECLEYNQSWFTRALYWAKKIGFWFQPSKKQIELTHQSVIERTVLLNKLESIKPDHIIEIDLHHFQNLQAKKNISIHLLSLGLLKMELHQNASPERLSSIIIESKVRYDIVFKESGVPYFLVPVSPVHRLLEKPISAKGDVLYCGSALTVFGIYHCLELAAKFSSIRLTIKGSVTENRMRDIETRYPEEIKEGRIIVDTNYTLEEDMQSELSKYRIGLCFYDQGYKEMRNFHFNNVNSQKIYRYYSSGVPVIANRLLGLQSVEDFGAGILIDDFSPETIMKAIEEIEEDYPSYVRNCFCAAEHFSFDRHLKPFVDYLRESD